MDETRDSVWQIASYGPPDYFGTLRSAGGARTPEEMRPAATGHLTDFAFAGGYQTFPLWHLLD